MQALPFQRNPGVDALRGVAIAAVLLLHFTLAYGIEDSPLGSLLSKQLLHALAINGNYGVTIFFTISGFLITSHSLRRWGELGDIDLAAFYTLRATRILPALVGALAIIVALGVANVPFFSSSDGGHNLPARHFWVSAGSVLTFWHNVLMQSLGYFNYCLNIYWSLSVEEAFYLLMPLVCLGRKRMLTLVCLAGVIAGPLYRSIHADNELFYMYGYLACFDAISIGCLVALVNRRFSLPARAAFALRIICALAIAYVYLRGIKGNEVLGFSLIALASAGYLFACAGVQPALKPSRLGAPLRWLGRHSYELYLYHIIVLALMRNLVDISQLTYVTRLPWFLLFLLLSAASAALVEKYLSAPASVYLRAKLLDQRGRAPAPLGRE